MVDVVVPTFGLSSACSLPFLLDIVGLHFCNQPTALLLLVAVDVVALISLVIGPRGLSSVVCAPGSLSTFVGFVFTVVVHVRGVCGGITFCDFSLRL